VVRDFKGWSSQPVALDDVFGVLVVVAEVVRVLEGVLVLDAIGDHKRASLVGVGGNRHEHGAGTGFDWGGRDPA
jgi:hypothetical protein